MVFSTSNAPRKAVFFLSFFCLLRLAAGQGFTLPPVFSGTFPPIASPTVSPAVSAPSTIPTTPAPTPRQTTELIISPSPSQAATLAPVAAPTAAPVTPPTNIPTFGPTLAPITAAPVSAPTLAPITGAPVTVSTLPPTQVPITATPTLAPVTAVPTFAPVTALPTFAPVTAAPTFAPTAAPVTLSPTRSPVSSAPVDVVITSFPTLRPATSFPTFAQQNPTAAPISAPTLAPVTSPPVFAPTPAPVAAVTLAPVTSGPTLGPTRAPTNSPTSGPTKSPVVTPRPTASPSLRPTLSPVVVTAPTAAPQIAPERRQVTFSGNKLSLEGVLTLDPTAVGVFESVTEVWFNEFYNGVSGRRNLAFGDGIAGVEGMEATVTFRGQEFFPADATANREFPVIVIEYDQQITYLATSDAPTAREIILRPFEDTDGNAKYAADLRSSGGSSGDQTFLSVQSPIDTPVIPDGGGDGGLSGGAIAGIAVGGAIALLVVAFLGVRMMGNSDGSGYVDPDTRPPAQFNVASSEDVSAMEDPAQKTLGAGDASLAEYGDQSVATVDYDYSKAYGGGDTSVVSSAGGTFGDHTRQSTGDVAALGAARAALGASFDSESQFQANVKEEVLVINAPPGKLGVVIDTPDDGAPVVHAVKDSSVIADQIRVGDKLVAVDNEDVRSMTAIKVSKLISRKGANSSRKLTVVRTSVVEGP